MSYASSRAPDAHSTTRRRGNASNKRHDGLVLLVELSNVLGRVLLHRSTNLANHNQALRPWVFQEEADGFEGQRPWERIASNADAQSLT
jgi:hypothetical protein